MLRIGTTHREQKNQPPSTFAFFNFSGSSVYAYECVNKYKLHMPQKKLKYNLVRIFDSTHHTHHILEDYTINSKKEPPL